MRLGNRLKPARAARELDALERCQRHLGVVDAEPSYADPANPTRGKCYYAAVALYQFLGGGASGYRLLKAQEDIGTHYWVETPANAILDPTSEQFVILRREPPYAAGKRVSPRPNMKVHLPLLKAMRDE